MSAGTRIVHKTCNLCEAMCGLRIEVEGHGPATQVKAIRGDPDDPLSHGAMCPKAMGLAELQTDPDRLRTPLRRTPSGAYEEIGWDAALAECSERLADIQLRDGNDAVATYLGNPGAHNIGIILYLTGLYSALGSGNRYSASSLDQNPKHAASLLLYGNILSIPVPDVDHTDFLLMLGANPVVSNGSLMSAPGFRRRLRALQARGGKLVVVDPRRSETAALADQHIAIEPGRDPLFLAAIAHTLVDEKLGRASHLEGRVDGRDALAHALAPFAPERVADALGMPAEGLRGLTRAFAAAERAACYGRFGTCMGAYGTLSNWLMDVINLLSGNLDRVGGSLFPKPAADLAALLELRGAPGEFGTRRTRVRGAPCFGDEAPTACLAEEITTPGPGQIKGMVTLAGNPCLSAPNGGALTRAFASLEFHVAIDFYLNETTRHAHIILPPTASLEHDNHEILFHGFAVHNTAKYSPVVIPPQPGQREDWEILSALALGIAARKQRNPLARAALARAERFVPAPRRALDWLLRIGHYGDGFKPWRTGLRLRDLEAAPSGIDLGPLAPRLDAMLAETGRRIDLAPPRILAELARLEGDHAATPRAADELLLIGRRDPRTNNSWGHNWPLSAAGRERCTLQMHPQDAAARGLSDGARARIRSRVGEVEAPVEVCERIRPGVVSLPHGWGHDAPGTRMRIAATRPGVNCNALTDDAPLEGIVSNAILNGVPVRVEAAGEDAAGTEDETAAREASAPAQP